jgi:hypothetical protein
VAAALYNGASGVATLVGVTVRKSTTFEYDGGTIDLATLGQLALHGSTVRAEDVSVGLLVGGGGHAALTDTLIAGGFTGIMACPGTLVAHRVTIAGGRFFGALLGGDATFVNSTIGGGPSVAVFVGSSLSDVEETSCGESGTVRFFNSTIASSRRFEEDEAPGQIYVRGKDYKATLRNTIVGGPCGVADGGQIVSEGFNIATDSSCGLTGPGDKPDTDPKLGPLQDNGGPTPTRAPLAGSLALDNGTNTDCPATDQRGVSRPRGAACDMGAFEAGALVAAVGLNETLFTAGDSITYEGTVNAGPTPVQADIYLGALLPDLATFLSLVQLEPDVIGVVTGPQPVPYRANATAAPLAIRFDYFFEGPEPLGVYHTYAALIAAGKDPMDPANQLSVDIQTFELVPPPEPEGEPQ